MAEFTFLHQTAATPKQAEQFQVSFRNQPQSVSRNICRVFLEINAHQKWYNYHPKSWTVAKKQFSPSPDFPVCSNGHHFSHAT